MSDAFAGLACVLLVVCTGCKADSQVAQADAPESNAPGAQAGTTNPAEVVDLPDQPVAGASQSFWDHWGDGRAEMATYRGTQMRYGEPREARLVLIYVTEPHDRRTFVKDDDVAEQNRIQVMKLNRALKFQTGVYPYTVMTSVFSPVADWGRPRFQPAKITLTSQEWCGHVFHGLWAGPETARQVMHSYFAGEGDDASTVELPGETLYEDALPIQLRELDGAFNNGERWEGHLVPSLWHRRRAHSDVETVEATISRKKAELDGTPVTRFTVEMPERTTTYDVAREAPHHLLRIEKNDGTAFRLDQVERMPYWRLNGPDDGESRRRIGLPPDAFNLESTSTPESGSSTPR
jgi:hypothetical protein